MCLLPPNTSNFPLVVKAETVRFDWRAFCTEHNVPFVTSGPNTARGHVSIRCPFCGDGDPSQHMGLSLDRNDPAWGCFRNSAHRGRNPRRLVQRLLGISFAEAWRKVEQQQGATADSAELERSTQALIALADRQEHRAENCPPWPTEFKPVIPGRGYAGQFITYLERERGFIGHAGEVSERYGLHYALTGDYAWRLIFPIHEADGRLLGWTGRDIRPKAWLRYRSSAPLPQRALYNAHLAARSEGDTLVVVEGPVDAIKVDYFGAPFGVAAVATLGTALPAERRAALASFCRRFERVALLFDEETLTEVLGLVPELAEASGRDVLLWRPGAKDPGAMGEDAIREFLGHHLAEA